MKTVAIVLGSVAIVVVLVAGGLWAGTAWAQGRWDSEMAGCGTSFVTSMRSGVHAGMGRTMMGPDLQRHELAEGMAGSGDWEDMPCGNAFATPGEGEITSLEEVETSVHDYVERLGYTGLEVTEVMEFEYNYYAIVAEEDTGIGAMEVLVDKPSGAVGPEPGPNMMWNAKYGMHGGGGMMGMMGGYATDEMTLSPEEAHDVAQRWLDANLAGRTAGEADPFFGYYTLHFLNDGEIEGMLSVHGSSGDVWYHSWHGGFITMIEGHE